MTHRTTVPAAGVEAVNIELDITIDAAVERVWKALLEEPSAWWHRDFYATPKPHKFIIEPKVGGRMYEDTGNGSGLLWYTVTVLKPKEELSLVGAVMQPFGGPNMSMLRLVLEAQGDDTTLLKLTNSIFGVIGDCEAEAGWRQLFEVGLKEYVESGKRQD